MLHLYKGRTHDLLFARLFSVSRKCTHSTDCKVLFNIPRPFTRENWKYDFKNNSELITRNRRFSSSLSDASMAADGGASTATSFYQVCEPIVAPLKQTMILASSFNVPWWAIVVVSTVILRATLTLPVSLKQWRSWSYFRRHIQPDVKLLGSQLSTALVPICRKKGMDYSEYEKMLRTTYRSSVKSLYAFHHFSPLRLFLLPWVQLPLFLYLSLTFRSILEDDSMIHLLSSQGIFQKNLTIADEMCIFPVLLGGMHLINLELQRKMGNMQKDAKEAQQEPSLRQKILFYVFRGVAVASIPFAAQMPFMLILSWSTSALYSLVQNIVFLQPKIYNKFVLEKTVMRHPDVQGKQFVVKVFGKEVQAVKA